MEEEEENRGISPKSKKTVECVGEVSIGKISSQTGRQKLGGPFQDYCDGEETRDGNRMDDAGPLPGVMSQAETGSCGLQPSLAVGGAAPCLLGEPGNGLHCSMAPRTVPHSGPRQGPPAAKWGLSPTQLYVIGTIL